MLVVRLSLRPSNGGPERPLGTVEIANDLTGDEDLANYDVAATRGGRSWRRARVEMFPRKEQGAFELLYRALEAMLLERTARRRKT